MTKALLWFRSDLRISDNPGLSHAVKHADEVAAIYILDESKDARHMGAASKWWLHHALEDVSINLKKKYGIELLFAKGESAKIIFDMTKKNGFDTVIWNRLYEPYNLKRDKKLEKELEKLGITIETFNASLLAEPDNVKNGSGDYYKVFGAFHRYYKNKVIPREIIRMPGEQDKRLKKKLKLLKLDELKLLPQKPDWGKKFEKYWQPTEKCGQKALYDFLENNIKDYPERRNIPSVQGTSRISPYLAFGQISPQQIISVLENFEAKHKGISSGVERFITQIHWREFSYYLQYHYPMESKNFRSEFDRFEWKNDKKNFVKWQKGLTGYPIVDAGMREMWETGWMHNRVRMVVASFLVKHLLINWVEGERWFWDCLVDANNGNNSAGWQWTACTGVDAAPYFRIFNPVMQGLRFDKKGEYVKKWCPELKNLPEKYIHSPWTAPEKVLKEAGIVLEKDYPRPVVDHKFARDRAMANYRKIRNYR